MTPKMSSNLLVLFAMTLVIVKVEGHSSDIQYVPHNDKCKTYAKASEECKNNGGDLARLKTDEQREALAHQLPSLASNKKYWIANDSCNAGPCCVIIPPFVSGSRTISNRKCLGSFWYICQKENAHETTPTTTPQTFTATTTISSSTTTATTSKASEGSKAAGSYDKKPTSIPTAGKPDKSTNKSPGSKPASKPNGGKPAKSTGESPGNKPTVNPGNKPTSPGGAKKQQGTGKQKTKMDEKIDELVKKMKEMSVEDVNSIEEVTSMTSALVKEMKNNKEEKGNVLKASQAIEDFGIKYARYHFNASNFTTGTIIGRIL